MRRKISISTFLIGTIGVLCAQEISFDDNWASQNLFKRLWVPILGVDTDGSICMEVGDSIAFFYVNTLFYPRPAKCKIQKISARWLPTSSPPESVADVPNFILNFLMLATYPQLIAQSHFQGYAISLLKKKVPIGGIECFKISVKAIPEDNREESPFSGYFYVSTKPPYHVVRAESEFGKKEDVVRRIKWDFLSMGGFDFPRKIALTLTSPMCGFLTDFNMEAVFPSINVIPDTSGR